MLNFVDSIALWTVYVKAWLINYCWMSCIYYAQCFMYYAYKNVLCQNSRIFLTSSVRSHSSIWKINNNKDQIGLNHHFFSYQKTYQSFREIKCYGFWVFEGQILGKSQGYPCNLLRAIITEKTRGLWTETLKVTCCEARIPLSSGSLLLEFLLINVYDHTKSIQECVWYQRMKLIIFIFYTIQNTFYNLTSLSRWFCCVYGTNHREIISERDSKEIINYWEYHLLRRPLNSSCCFNFFLYHFIICMQNKIII